jgi:hypothetical protein
MPRRYPGVAAINPMACFGRDQPDGVFRMEPEREDTDILPTAQEVTVARKPAPLQWWRRQREIRMLRSWYVRVCPGDMSSRRSRVVGMALSAGPVCAVVAAVLMVTGGLVSGSGPLAIAMAVAALVVLAGALWRSAASLTLSVALAGSAAAILGTHGSHGSPLHWPSVTALAVLATVMVSSCLLRACREPDAVSWIEDEPATEHVPGHLDDI